MIDWICDRLGHPLDNLGSLNGYAATACHCGSLIFSEDFFDLPGSYLYMPAPWMKAR